MMVRTGARNSMPQAEAEEAWRNGGDGTHMRDGQAAKSTIWGHEGSAEVTPAYEGRRRQKGLSKDNTDRPA